MKILGGLLAVLVAGGVSVVPEVLAGGARPPSQVGAWSAPFEEDPANVQYPVASGPTEHCRQTTDPQLGPYLVCKPAGSAVSVLPDGRLLYWNNLEGTENI